MDGWVHHFAGIGRRVRVLDGTLRRHVGLDRSAPWPALHGSFGRPAAEAERVAVQFVGADLQQHRALFAGSRREALGRLARCLRLVPDDVVLVVPTWPAGDDWPWWVRTVAVAVDAFGRPDEAHLDQLLQTHARRVRLLVLPGASAITGQAFDLHRMADKVHAARGTLLVDWALPAAHRALAVGGSGAPGTAGRPDFVLMAGPQLYAPAAGCVLIGRRDRLEAGRDRSVDAAGAPALAAAMQALQAIGLEAIARHEAGLTALALQRLAAIDGLQIHGESHPRHAVRRLGLVSFGLQQQPPAAVAAVLATEFGIDVQHAAAHGTLPAFVQIGFGPCHTADDVETLAAALQRIARGEFQGVYTYEEASGDYAALGWAPQPHNGRLAARLPPTCRTSSSSTRPTSTANAT